MIELNDARFYENIKLLLIIVDYTWILIWIVFAKETSFCHNKQFYFVFLFLNSTAVNFFYNKLKWMLKEAIK